MPWILVRGIEEDCIHITGWLAGTLLAGVTGLVVTLALVPAIISLAVRWGLLDVPDGNRRIHALAVPRLGGVAVFLGVWASLGALLAADAVGVTSVFGSLRDETRRVLIGLAIASTIMFLVGLRDDVRGVRPGQKLFAQCVAALVLASSGFAIESVGLIPGVGFPLGPLAIPIAVAWIVLVTNAFNLIDGLDGLASSTALVSLTVAAGAAIVIRQPHSVPVLAAVAGPLVGFLIFNRHPARIFMGDAGSLSVGMALAVLTVVAGSESDGRVDLLVPLFALAFPLLDTGIAIIRRWLRGDSFSRADGRHIHHQLVALGLSQGRTVVLLTLCSLAIGALAFPLSFARPTIIIALGTTALALVPFFLLYAIGLLNYHEFFEARASVTSGVRKARGVIRDRIRARDVATEIATCGTAQDVRFLLARRAEMFGFSELGLYPAATGTPQAAWNAAPGIRIWRTDWLVNARTRDGEGPFVLHIFATDGGRAIPISPDRIARILVPALEAALPRLAFATDAPVTTSVERRADSFATPTLSTTGKSRRSGPFVRVAR